MTQHPTRPEDVSDVYQLADEAPTTVPVEIVGTTRVIVLPSIAATRLTRVGLNAAEPTQIVGRDPRRSRVVIRPVGAAILISTSRPAAQGADGYDLPDGTTIELRGATELWAVSADAAVLNILIEQWAG